MPKTHSLLGRTSLCTALYGAMSVCDLAHLTRSNGTIPANDPAREAINDERHINKATPGRNEREVGHPKFIGLRGPELAIDLVQGALICRLAVGCLDLLATPNALNAKLAHQTFDGTAGDIDLLTLHCMPQLTCPVDRSVLLPNVFHLLAKIPIGVDSAILLPEQSQGHALAAQLAVDIGPTGLWDGAGRSPG